ncbi:uncharacterized protein LACBIDRAFT_327925 [Laccaria bicolor S238N-H82]|uniref:Predicted protein n=1 Tax=Laccaria bicolor (strain S238N-H82 / ATCC MYA-4686) TaxID=486041 RepID=B0DD87_LACBS|nr:uncharacterized protein LACBIDRAFT_327925 [Laccaria bicolor S238N-H82]EDR07565.1 predicted protein [Laccaria bicolor S238N-H82]|eukprot:XP_001881957.1 predicted protein [Laccaria bicolor S238N-H82]
MRRNGIPDAQIECRRLPTLDLGVINKQLPLSQPPPSSTTPTHLATPPRHQRPPRRTQQRREHPPSQARPTQPANTRHTTRDNHVNARPRPPRPQTTTRLTTSTEGHANKRHAHDDTTTTSTGDDRVNGHPRQRTTTTSTDDEHVSGRRATTATSTDDDDEANGRRQRQRTTTPTADDDNAANRRQRQRTTSTLPMDDHVNDDERVPLHHVHTATILDSCRFRPEFQDSGRNLGIPVGISGGMESIALAQQCETMIQEATLHLPTHFVADPFIAVIKNFLPPSKTSKLDLTQKTNPTNPGHQIAMMMPGPHSKRLNDLDRLKTAAVTALGHHAPPDMLVEPAAPKVTQKRKLESAELETDKEAPLTKSKKGKGKGRVKAKSAEVVESDEGGEAPVTKEKGKAVVWVEIDEEVPAVKKKKEAKRAQVKEDDDEYDDEEDALKGKKKAPELYDLIPAKEVQLKKNLVLHFLTDPTNPIIWDSTMLQQAIDNKEFEPPKTTDHYVKEAWLLERDEKEAGAPRKKGGKGGKQGPFYWGPHDQLDFEGPVLFKYAYDPERNPIDENGIRRYLVMDVFAMPCTKCTTMKKPAFCWWGANTFGKDHH